MSIQSGRALNNLLLRRVQRHQSMTTLFHSHPVHSTQAMQTPLQPEAETVIQAKPMDVQAPAQPDLPTASPKTTAVRQVQPPLPVDSETKGTKAPAAPSREASAQPDAGWKRLQTIFRKHQEQENPTVESIKPPQPSSPTNPDIQRTAEKPKPSKIVNDTQQSEIPDGPQPAQVSPLVQRKTNAAEAKNASVEQAPAKPENTMQAPETQAPHVDQPTVSMPETSKATIDQASDQPNAKVIPPSEPQMYFEEQGIEEEPRELNTLPLESVWNVQRTEEPEPTERPVPRPTRSHHVSTDSVIPKPVLQRSELESHINSNDWQNESEVMEEPAKLHAVSSMEADVETTMRAPVEVLAPSRPRPAPVNSAAPSAVIQKQPQDHPEPTDVHEDRLVETAIGPLPADLWQLIGQKPPESKPRQSVSETMSPSMPQQVESSKPQQVSRHETTSQPISAIKMVDFPAAVQREPIATDASSSETPRDISISSSPHNVESELDVDELARKVYARIRQRLSTEWERLRRR